MTAILVILVVALLAVGSTVLVVKNLIYICQPNEVLVFSGARRNVGGRSVGYSLVQGGRRIRIPLLERVDRLDLTNMVIDINVRGAYSRGGIPLNVAAVANVKVASTEPTIGNAIERFLNKPRGDLIRVTKETLEGNLRGVLATLTPEEVNHDRVKFAQSLLSEADIDLKRLGLTLDTLKIQHVTDDRGYLDSIGRKQSAALVMKSRVAEAENQALAAERAAENLETKEIARIEAEIAMARADAERRIIDAQTKKQAMISEEEAQVTAQVARAEAELHVQTARLDQVRLQLEADVIRPAEAKREAMLAEAIGNAAKIVEEGKATATSLREVAHSWKGAGDDARRIFVAQKFGRLVEQMLSTVDKLSVNRITLLAGNEQTGHLGARALQTNEQLKEAVGVDVAGLLQSLGGGTVTAAAGAPKAPTAPERGSSSHGSATTSSPSAAADDEPRPWTPPSTPPPVPRVSSSRTASWGSPHTAGVVRRDPEDPPAGAFEE